MNEQQLHNYDKTRVQLGLNQYQKTALKTAIFPKEQALYYFTLGLSNEAGEVAGKVKKLIRDDNGEISANKQYELMGELGDVLWYLAVLADFLGLELEEVAKENMTKLNSRQLRGQLGGSGDNR